MHTLTAHTAAAHYCPTADVVRVVVDTGDAQTFEVMTADRARAHYRGFVAAHGAVKAPARYPHGARRSPVTGNVEACDAPTPVRLSSATWERTGSRSSGKRTAYIARTVADCRDRTDRDVFELVQSMRRTVKMGCITGEMI